MGLKTKLGLAAMSSAAGAAMIVGGSFALFSANANNSGNTFTAGTVKIADFTGHTVASTMEYFNNLAPGDTDTKSITIKNTGTLDAWVNVDQAATQATETGALFGGSTPLQLSFGANTPQLIKAGDSATFPVTYSFPRPANDTYQGASGSANIVFDAVQSRNNTTASGSGPQTIPTNSPFITPQDFNVTTGWDWTVDSKTYSGYSIGFSLVETPKAAGLNGITVDVYDGNKLLQQNTAKSAMLSYDGGTSLSTPVESDAFLSRFTDSYWTYGAWKGSTNEKPTKAVITVTDSQGHTWTAVDNAQ